MHLVIVESSQIQPYIFGSNHLRENIGASYLVASATEGWAFDAVNNVTQNHNIKRQISSGSWEIDEAKRIEDDAINLSTEVIYAGGGNFVVLFQEKNQARAFTQTLSRRVLKDAPGLQLVIIHHPFEWTQSLAREAKNAFIEQAAEKHSLIPSNQLLGLGVTVTCQSTGLPAAEVVRPIPSDPTSAYPVSTQISAKIDVAGHQGIPVEQRPAEQRLRSYLPPPDGYAYPSELDHLGRRSGEQSHIAVVHADGNDMGQLIANIGKAHPTPDENRNYIRALRDFSNSVEEAAQAALNHALKQLTDHIKDGNVSHPRSSGLYVSLSLDLRRERLFLPFRPLVFGGDDVTFVCDGQLGLSLALAYLSAFEEETARRPACKGKITACAGIAIVRSHYPFARAYRLAEELCSEAKNYRRTKALDGTSCLDWHFASSGLSGSIKEIRSREYTVKGGDSLTLRPVTLGQNREESYKEWSVVHQGVTEFQGELWAGRRNKIKALRDALRNGGASVESFLMKFNQGRGLPNVDPSMLGWPAKGWHGARCGYFDSVELADWFIPL